MNWPNKNENAWDFYSRKRAPSGDFTKEYEYEGRKLLCCVEVIMSHPLTMTDVKVVVYAEMFAEPCTLARCSGGATAIEQWWFQITKY